MKALRFKFAGLTEITAFVCAVCIAFGVPSAVVVPVVVAQTQNLTVQVNRPGAMIPKTLFGLFFEDINFAADGGIYPERIKNRSFEIPDPMMGWKQMARKNFKGTTYVINQNPLAANNPRFLRIAAEADGKGYGVTNEGFRGIGVEQNNDYTFSVYARTTTTTTTTAAAAQAENNGTPTSNAARQLKIEIEDADGEILSSATISGIGAQWREYKTTLRAMKTSGKAHLNVLVENTDNHRGDNAVDVDMVSLYPKNTFNNRPNGLRADLVKLLKDMKPGFLRFPGGCIVEGRTLESRYQWKTTIGDLDARKLIVNRWNTEFRHRPTPDYYQSFGLGFYEYFLLSEDIGAEPLPIINCGMACQFNSGELASLDDLDGYIQDALDLIDFANAPVTSLWGRRRAAMGHPAPFNLKMIGIGNEQWGAQYVERYKVFAQVLKDKHPEIQLIASAGPSPNDERFRFLWTQMRALNADIVDEHYYEAPQWFRENVNRYDTYPRTGPKVFAGEFAAQSVGIASPDNRNNWECALSEAAFMTGLERNADLVQMASYAPLFAHLDAWQWTPNMIWFDNLKSYGTPNYYVQKLFSANKGTRILPVLLNNSTKNGREDLFASSSFDEQAGEVILKVVNAGAAPKHLTIDLAGVKNTNGKATAEVLTAPQLNAENSLEAPTKIAPVESRIEIPANNFTYSFPAQSLTVLRIGVGRKS